MSNKCVIVLAPNGRRQNVKVTPNTTILQVLEEVCCKQGLKAEEYDVMHHSKVLDATSIMRYTGLPNNAQLEMTAAVKTRAETCVKVGLALESGARVMGEFKPLDSLWHVVKTLCPDEADTDEAGGILPVIFYLGREECGAENLKKTTLRSLGLTSGGAILRFFKKAPEDLHRQANVSAPLSRPVPSQESLVKRSRSGSASAPQKALNAIACEPSTSQISHSQPLSEQLKENEIVPVPGPIKPSDKEDHPCPREDTTQNVLSAKNDTPLINMEMDYEDSSQSATHISSLQSVSSLPCTNEPEETIIFLGERNAVLFDVATARACRPEDVPDDFFNLTTDDAKQLLRDLKRKQAALEEQPLVTSQYRELEKSKQMLSTLHQYKHCVIKVQFPNQLVLQGTFTPLEKVQHVLDFVRKYLQDPTIEFELFTTPPKNVLTAEHTLYDAQCVPGALVYFNTSAPCQETGSYIREDVMAQVSTATAAATAATATRCDKRNAIISDASDVMDPSLLPYMIGTSVPANDVRATTSTAPSTGFNSSNQNSIGKKVPKWFKPLK